MTYFYDHLILNEENRNDDFLNHFLQDIHPLIQILAKLFFNIKTKRKLIQFNIFFTKLFDLKSTELKTSTI